jgi:hypothetical protein
VDYLCDRAALIRQAAHGALGRISEGDYAEFLRRRGPVNRFNPH